MHQQSRTLFAPGFTFNETGKVLQFIRLLRTFFLRFGDSFSLYNKVVLSREAESRSLGTLLRK